MLIQKLLKFLEHNERQYIMLRTQQNYSEAAKRLERLSKLVTLINAAANYNELHPVDVIKIVGVQRHLKALGCYADDPLPYVYNIATAYLGG